MANRVSRKPDSPPTLVEPANSRARFRHRLSSSRAGTMARSASGKEFVSAVIDECARICAAESFAVPIQIQDLTRGIYAQIDSNYGPSILIDMEDGRPPEGEHTIGDFVERACQRGMPVPILVAARSNLQAYEIIRAAARGRT